MGVIFLISVFHLVSVVNFSFIFRCPFQFQFYVSFFTVYTFFSFIISSFRCFFYLVKCFFSYFQFSVKFFLVFKFQFSVKFFFNVFQFQFSVSLLGSNASINPTYQLYNNLPFKSAPYAMLHLIICLSWCNLSYFGSLLLSF